MYLPYFRIKILTSRKLKTSLSSEQLGLRLIDNDNMTEITTLDNLASIAQYKTFKYQYVFLFLHNYICCRYSLESS